MTIHLTEEEMEAIIRLFQSPTGHQVKEMLEQKFMNRLSFCNDPYKTAFMEGQRSLALVFCAGANITPVVGAEHIDADDSDNTTD
ncbi:MAG: hypothetical protein DRH90_23775 [Deltaproteobacteria bacterium]|nr:MAG: hypothetical protein DRH90_23775 [Deltaproteobacteria bacterium]RLC15123.1 MAG: hypothetical protein DRI24_11735 [Deltaproteobacteria bacterium]